MIFENESIEKRKELITNMLQRGVCDVRFTKVNGETRNMPCTLQEHVVPAFTGEKKIKKKQKDDNLSVWCTDRNEWRSFKLANVIEVIPHES
jgi:hypothetical protein